MQGITKDDLKTLARPFPESVIGVKCQAISKERTRALLVLYVSHTHVQSRLDEVDPSWVSEVIEERRTNVVNVRMRLTVKGITRENVGEGEDPKSAYSDALKRCAMLFGVARYLYELETKWVPYDETKDKARIWTLADYQGRKQATVSPINHAKAEPNGRARDEGPQMAENQKVGNGADWVIDFGQYQGKRICDVPPEEMKSYIQYLERVAKQKGGLDGYAKALVERTRQIGFC